jgi:hypothetical protein
MTIFIAIYPSTIVTCSLNNTREKERKKNINKALAVKGRRKRRVRGENNQYKV